MNKLKFGGYFKVILLGLLTLLFQNRAGAEITFSASVDKKTVAVNESFTLTVTVSGDMANVPEPQIPSIPDFYIHSSGRSQNFSIINGKISSSVTFNYVLTPKFIGKKQIPPITLFHDRQKYVTSPIEIYVTQPARTSQPQTGQPQPVKPAKTRPGTAQPRERDISRDIFITAETDKASAYVHEQINLTVKFYTAIPLLGNPEYVAPQLKGLIAEDLPPIRNGETVINGVKYYFNEIRSAMFGIDEGEAMIYPAVVKAQVAEEEDVDPFDPNFFFQKFFAIPSARGIPYQVKTVPIKIKLKSLPENNRPASFKGAVGDYIISAEIDRKEVKAGEPVNFSIKINGRGNLKTVTAPEIGEMPDFKVFDTMSSLDITKHNDIVGGRKVFTTILIPKSAGRRKIPAVRFSFFNPETKLYQELQTSPMEINVLPGDAAVKQYSFFEKQAPAGITPVSADIHYIMEKIKPHFGVKSALKISGSGWINLAPALILAFSILGMQIKNARMRNPLLLKYKKARSNAEDRIEKAEELLEKDASSAAGILYSSLIDYLSDKLGADIGAITLKKTLELIKNDYPGIDDYVLSEVKTLWEGLERLRYAPSEALQSGVSDMITRYTTLLDLLEKGLKK
ncbi:MAG: protein BatD [Elusimicrobia bacterium]|nr:protein BatD [Elusimicrobiota bacterium]